MGNKLPLLDHLPKDLVAVADYERYSRARLDDNAWAYLASGAGDEITWGWNRQAFDRLAILPRVLASVEGGHTRVQLLGRTHESPVLLGPVAWQKLFHQDGELASAYAASALDTGFVVSTLSSYSLEDIAVAARQGGKGPCWFQLYWQHDRGINLDLVRRAEAAGYEALVLTVDAPINGIRNKEQRAGFYLPPGVVSANLSRYGAPPSHQLSPGQSAVFDVLMAHGPRWADLEWLLSQTTLPIIVKGILHPDDGGQAARLGAAAVVVSNHGGRTLDTLPATLDVLPRVVEAIKGKVPILLDGGIRRGTDVFKALALGATAVLLGRAYIHALAAAGPQGVAHVLRLLQDELAATMALSGNATLASITPANIWS